MKNFNDQTKLSRTRSQSDAFKRKQLTSLAERRSIKYNIRYMVSFHYWYLGI